MLECVIIFHPFSELLKFTFLTRIIRMSYLTILIFNLIVFLWWSLEYLRFFSLSKDIILEIAKICFSSFKNFQYDIFLLLSTLEMNTFWNLFMTHSFIYCFMIKIQNYFSSLIFAFMIWQHHYHFYLIHFILGKNVFVSIFDIV